MKCGILRGAMGKVLDALEPQRIKLGDRLRAGLKAVIESPDGPLETGFEIAMKIEKALRVDGCIEEALREALSGIEEEMV